MLLVYVVLEVGKFSAERNIKHQTNDHKSNKTDLVGFESRSKTTLIKTFKGLDGIQWKGFGVSKVLKGFNDHTVEIFCWILKKPQATEIFGNILSVFKKYSYCIQYCCWNIRETWSNVDIWKVCHSSSSSSFLYSSLLQKIYCWFYYRILPPCKKVQIYMWELETMLFQITLFHIFWDIISFIWMTTFLLYWVILLWLDARRSRP